MELHRQQSRWWIVFGLLLTVMIAVIAWLELQRVGDGRLFLFAVSWDAEPTAIEKHDARQSATDMQLPATAFLLVAGTAVSLSGPDRFQNWLPSTRMQWLSVSVLLISALMDLGSTLWFFHDGGIDLELHPGIRLFGYAYGRTVGPIAGKLVQVVGILAVACWLGRSGRVLIVIVTVFYLAASIHNVLQMPVFSR